MPADPPAAPEDAPMITFVAIAPDGTSDRLSFETEAEAQAAAEDHRKAGHSISWRVWVATLGRWVSIPGRPSRPAPRGYGRRGSRS